MKNYIVVKSHKLITSSYKITISEQRLVLACIAQIDSRKQITTENVFEVSAKDISELTNIPLQDAYRDLKTVANRLYERSIIINDPDPKNKFELLKTRWITSIGYIQKEGKISLRFAPDIIPYLSQLKEQFTQYKLVNISKFTSIYAIRLYELLIQWKITGKREVEIDWLKKQFQIENEYPRLFDLKKRVIDPAIKQINEYSDLWVKYSQKKQGRKISHFIFTFGLKNTIEHNPLDNDQLPIFKHLTNFSIAKKQAIKLCNDYSLEHLKNNIDYVHLEIKKGKAKENLAGFVITAIKNNYHKTQSKNFTKEEITKWANSPENRTRTTGKTTQEIIAMMKQ